MNGSKLEGRQRPEIDGLRAFAILPVVLFHARLGCPGGFIGVDVFFVISGFLIGGIILRELESGTFSFTRFWERRIRRIIPVLLFFFAVTLFAGWRILPPSGLASLASQTVAALLGVANFKMLALTGGYWAIAANSILLLHIWSLAVEEQFYLLMPIILVVSHRWFRRGTGFVITALFASSLFLSFYWGEIGYSGNFYLLPSRAWELLLGCLGAWAIQQRLELSKLLRQVAMTLGLLMILTAAFILHDDPKWPDARALLPTLGGLLILISPSSGKQNSWPVSLLSLPPLRFIGLISYSLYLWHWPMLVFLNNFKSDPVTRLDRWMVVGASIGLAALSWRFIEQPFRNKLRSLRVRTQPLVIGAAFAWLCLMALSCQMAKKPPQTGSSRPAFFNCPGSESIGGYEAGSHLADGGITFNGNGREPRCVLLGSSYAVMLGPVVQSLSDVYHIPCALFCQSAVSPLFVVPGSESHAPRKLRELRKRDELVKKYISQWRPDVIIVAARWNAEMAAWGKNLGPSWPSFPESFSNTVTWLGQHSSHVVLIGQIPQLPFQRGEEVADMVWRSYRSHGNLMPQLQEPAEATATRQKGRMFLQSCAQSNVTILDPAPIFQNQDHSLRYYGSKGIFYFDYLHLNSLGSMELKNLLEPLFKDMSH